MKSFTILTGLAAVTLASPFPGSLHKRQASPATDAVTVLPPSDDPWYAVPTNYENRVPGAVLKVRMAPGNLTASTTNASAAYNILYRTTDSQYRASWAVTTLFVPDTNLSTADNQLLSYQIPYDSAYINSSPSYALNDATYPDISAALGRGWYVNVPDYEGPLASFTAGVQSGHATIDSIRAVLNAGFGLVNGGTRYALWGYSGGALASEWAAELANQYAPEMSFAGAALGGLTPNVSSVLETVTGQATAGLIPAGILGLASQCPDLMTFLQNNIKTTGPYNATTFFAARNQTLLGVISTFAGQDITEYFVTGKDALLSPESQNAISRDGVMGFHGVPRMPLFAYKAIQDEVSPVEDTDSLIDRYCAMNANIRYDRNTVGSHGSEANNGLARAWTFLDQVLAGTYNATAGCQIQNVTISVT